MRLTKLITILFTLMISQSTSTFAATFDSVSHIHGAHAFGSRILMGTHEGLFQFVSQNNMKPIGKDRFDIMGLDSFGRTLFASGHPGPGSKLSNPVGLLRSDDSGMTWKSVSLLGEVDFHFLEVSGVQIIGENAIDGSLMYSKDSGRNWKKLGSNKFSDIALQSGSLGRVIAIDRGKLVRTSNAFTTVSKLSFKSDVTAIESIGKDLYIASKNKIFRSTDQAKSWKEVKSYESDISDISASSDILVVLLPREILTLKIKV